MVEIMAFDEGSGTISRPGHSGSGQHDTVG
jgi:hypothetical protein